jgi:hypothetical protein
MSNQLTATLRTLLLERKKEALQKGWGEIPSWVFTSQTGALMDPSSFRLIATIRTPAATTLENPVFENQASG